MLLQIKKKTDRPYKISKKYIIHKFPDLHFENKTNKCYTKIERFITHITDIWTFCTVYCKWSFIPLYSLNKLLQKHYLYRCSTQCMHWCTFRKPCSLNDLLHTIPVYGHFRLCRQWCPFISSCFLKDLLYTPLLYRWYSRSMQLVHLQITQFSEWFLTNITHTHTHIYIYIYMGVLHHFLIPFRWCRTLNLLL